MRSAAVIAVITALSGACGWAQRPSANWTPPHTGINSAYVKATAELLGHGLADPRGRQFAKVLISGVDDGLTEGEHIEAFGWVSKDGKDAVLVDGLDSKIQSVVGPADFKSAMLLSPRRQLREPGPPINAISLSTPALLLVLGQADLAEKAYRFWTDRLSASLTDDMFRELEACNRFPAAQALTEARDRDGLASVERAIEVDQIWEANANERGSNQLADIQKHGKEMRVLQADFTRRIRHPKPGPVDVQEVAKLNKPQQVAQLVAALDTAGARQKGKVSNQPLEQDSLVKAIEAEGQDAIPCLIDVIQNDNRLTRAITTGFGSIPMSPMDSLNVDFHSVREAAWDLIVDLWPSGQACYREDPTEEAGVLRATWGRISKLTEPERWLTVLEDNNANPEWWVQAANYLVQAEEKSIKGEASRVTGRPQIGALMTLRAMEEAETSVNRNYGYALAIGHSLAQWDLAASAKTNKLVCGNILGSVQNLGYDPIHMLGDAFGKVICDRVAARDTVSASQDFDKFAGFIDPNQEMPIKLFRILWAYPENAGTNAVGEKVFDRYVAFLNSPTLNSHLLLASIPQAIASPLLESAPFRRFVAKCLAATGPKGTAWYNDNGGNGQFVCQIAGFEAWSSATKSLAPTAPLDEHTPVTLADLVAQDVAGLQGAPEFSMVWPDSKRATARAEIIQWLQDDHRDWTAIVGGSSFWDR